MKKISIFLSLLSISLINACQPTTPQTPVVTSQPNNDSTSPSPSPTPTINPNSSIGMTVDTPKVGSVINVSFPNSLWLKPVLGTKLVYSVSVNGSYLSGDIIFLINRADNNTFTANINVFGNATEKTVEYAKLGEFFANPIGSFSGTEKIDYVTKYQGQENISVPASTYQDAYKIVQSYTQKDSTNKITSTVITQWYVKGIGVVKTEELITLESGTLNRTITELKELVR